MESPNFKSPQTPTNAKEFIPPKNLPEHLIDYKNIAESLRKKASEEILMSAQLTDLMVLRSAANEEHFHKIA